MAKAKKKSATKSTHHARAKRKPPTDKTSLAARAARAVTQAIAKAKKGFERSGKNDDMDVHVHVGDVVMMGFDEAVDAEEWGAREMNHEVAGGKSRGGRAARDTDAQDEKNRKVNRTIKFRKGSMRLEAVEQSRPARKKRAAKKTTRKTAKKTSGRARSRR